MLYGLALWGVAEPFAELASCYGYGDAAALGLEGCELAGGAIRGGFAGVGDFGVKRVGRVELRDGQLPEVLL